MSEVAEGRPAHGSERTGPQRPSRSPGDLPLRPVPDIYDAPWLAWTVRGAGMHLHPGRELATAYLVDRAAHYGLRPGGRILEIASALGGPARMIARHFAADVVCVDMNGTMQRELLRLSREEGLIRRLHPLRARTERLPLRDGSFDGAWSQDAMCHMDERAVVPEVWRTLRPGGIFAFSDWMTISPLEPEDWLQLSQHWGFPSLPTLAEYVSLLAEQGFDLLLAEDRTRALRNAPAVPSDQEAFEHDFVERWGKAELKRQKAPGELWQRLVKEGKMTFGAVIARKPR